MSLINIALTGTQAAQAGLNTTSQNIANVATPGYTRQAAHFVSMQVTNGNRSAGMGVAVPSLIRFSNAYQSQQMWRSASDLGQHATAQPYLTHLEQVMGDSNSSISSGLDGLLSALNAATVEPTSTPLRQQVITAADSLGQRVNTLSEVIAGQITSIHQQRAVDDRPDQRAVAEIATLNQKISAAQAGRRPELVADRRARPEDRRARRPRRPAGRRPARRLARRLAAQRPAARDRRARLEADDPGQRERLADDQARVLERVVHRLRDRAWRPARRARGHRRRRCSCRCARTSPTSRARSPTKVNGLLSAGFDLNGVAGGRCSPTTRAARPACSRSPRASPRRPRLLVERHRPGNSDQLLALVDLGNQPITVSSLGTVLLGDADTQLVGKLGTASQQNQAAQATAQTVRDQAEENWKSTSGVNSDEEAVNLVQYQQMYQANMKVIAMRQRHCSTPRSR
jgi:flagellar hook-associated protein 1 FlgK